MAPRFHRLARSPHNLTPIKSSSLPTKWQRVAKSLEMMGGTRRHKLFQAVETGQLDDLKAMVRVPLWVSLRWTTYKGGYGNTVLHVAANNGQKDIVEWLIQRGYVKPGHRDLDKWSDVYSGGRSTSIR